MEYGIRAVHISDVNMDTPETVEPELLCVVQCSSVLLHRVVCGKVLLSDVSVKNNKVNSSHIL